MAIFQAGFIKHKNNGFGTVKLGLIYSINEQSSADLSHVVELGKRCLNM